MPITQECPLCGFNGNHGFGAVNGGMYFYHSINSKHACYYYIGDDNKA